MPVIEVETLLRALPQVQEGESVLVLELSLRRMAAHLYQMQGDSWTLPYHDDDHRQLDIEIQVLMAGLNDPLLDRLIVEMGIFWTPEREITLEDVIESSLPVLDRLLASVRNHTTAPRLVLVGVLCLEEQFMRRIMTTFPQDELIDVVYDTHPTWTLPAAAQVQTELEFIKTAALEEYYDLILLRVNGKALSWERLNLFYPGMGRTVVKNKVLQLAPQTQSVYFWIGRFENDETSLDFEMFDPQQLVTALELRDLDGRRQLPFSAHLTTDRRVKVTIPTDVGTLTTVHNRIAAIYQEERQQMWERTIPIETAIIIDQTLVPGVYERIKRLLVNLLRLLQSGDRWLTYFYNTHVCTSLGSRTRFVDPVEMERLLEAHKYQDVYHNGDFVPVHHVLDRLTQLDWHGRESNYFILFTHHPAGDTPFQELTQGLYNQYGITGIVVWLKQYDFMEATERKNDVGSLIPGPNDHNILFDDLENDEARETVLQSLLQLLAPTTTRELDLRALHWPLLDHLTG